MAKDTRVTLQAKSGNLNSQHGSLKAYVFHSPARGSVRIGRKETYLGNAIQECPGLGSKITTQTVPARMNVRPEIGGKVFDTTWLLRDGEVIKLFAKGRVGTHLARERTAILFIKLREDGPLTRVHVTLPSGVPDTTFQTWDVAGRFDVLTIEEAEFEGVTVLEHLRGQGAPHSVSAVFRVEVIEQERRAKAKIVMKQVGNRVMPVVKRRRALEL